MPVCRHCGSPARLRPCWWEYALKRQGITYDPGGGDPPCEGDEYDENMRSLARRRRVWPLIIIVAGIAFIVIAWNFRG